MASEFKKKIFWRAVVAEFLAMILFVFISIGSALGFNYPVEGNKTSGAIQDNVKVSLAFGLSIATLAQSVGHISGAHLNPAVTLGLLLSCQISIFRALMYIIAQSVGAIVATAILSGITSSLPGNTLGLNGVSGGSVGRWSRAGLTSGSLVQRDLTVVPPGGSPSPPGAVHSPVAPLSQDLVVLRRRSGLGWARKADWWSRACCELGPRTKSGVVQGGGRQARRQLPNRPPDVGARVAAVEGNASGGLIGELNRSTACLAEAAAGGERTVGGVPSAAPPSRTSIPPPSLMDNVQFLTQIDYTGCGINPARSFGSAVIANNFEHHWIFWVGPFIGGALAALIYDFILAPRSSELTDRMKVWSSGQVEEYDLDAEDLNSRVEMKPK
ncbi:aquaporin-1 [Petaurus breviceps papuanus]|uniref:aquaporin-1 n=1 Tax=Petaurus breviceps papuanus TaxID=3040969 RepID=UPI0036DEB752